MRYLSWSPLLALLWIALLWIATPDFNRNGLQQVAHDDIIMLQGANTEWPVATNGARPSEGTFFEKNAFGQASFVLPSKDGLTFILPRLPRQARLWVNNIPLGTTEASPGMGPALGPWQTYAPVGPIFLAFAPNRFDIMDHEGFGWAGVGPIWFTDLVQGAAFSRAFNAYQVQVQTWGMAIGIVALFAGGMSLFLRGERVATFAGLLVGMALLVQGRLPMPTEVLWLLIAMFSGVGAAYTHSCKPVVASLFLCAFVAATAGLALGFWLPPPNLYLKVAGLSATGAFPLCAFGLPFLASTQLRALLQEFVSARTKIKELAKTIEQQEVSLHAAIRNHAVQEERQRFVRDMHDGVGGQLLSLLMQVRTRSIGHDRIETELQRGLHDLRLMADSLDHVGDDLDLALSTFERRASQQARAANVELVWNKSASLNQLAWDGRKILNLYRILQEALTNCLRHAHARSITFEFEPDASVLGLIVTISDDGDGFNHDVTRGRGLANIEKRAAALGCTVFYQTGLHGLGTQIRIATKS